MDIAKLKTTETTTVHLRDPETGEKLYENDEPVTITLQGFHTDAWQDEQSAVDAERERLSKRAKGAGRREMARLLAAVTTAWSAVDGECTKDSALKLYEPEGAAWLRSQLNDALIEHAKNIKK